MINEADIKRAMKFVQIEPMSKAQLSKDAHMGKAKAARVLEVMEHRGMVKRAFFGRKGWRYAMPALADVVLAAESERAGRIREIRREICRRYRAKLAGCPIDDREDVDTWPVKRVLISANEAPPMSKRGPASVWELAA
jgi:dTDP-4-amino-4,6-dideoxygalactose transaminase